MGRDDQGQKPAKPKSERGAVKNVQQTRVADGEGREKPSGRGKEQQIAEKKEARSNVKNRGMQKKGAEKRRPPRPSGA